MRTHLFMLLCCVALTSFACSSDPSGQSNVDADVAETPDAAEDFDSAGDTVIAIDTSGDTADAAADIALDETPDRYPVTGAGPYRVGYRETYLTYEPAGVDGERTIRVAMWYPTLDETGYETRYMAIIARPDVITDAEPAPIEDQPVFVFSHGSWGVAEQTYLTMEFFASHGWLVLAPDHTGNTFENYGEPIPPDVFIGRPQDISTVLDFAYGLTDTEFPLGEPGDDVVMGGHSFGGYTTFADIGTAFAVDQVLAACEDGELEEMLCDAVTPEVEAILRNGFEDPRIDVAIPMAPGAAAVFSTTGLQDLDVPVLLFTGSLDTMTPNASEGDVFWSAMDGPDDIRVDFATAGHMSFTSLCDDLPQNLLENGCGEDYIDPDALAYTVNAYALAFARYHLWGDATDLDLLDGTRSLSEDVSLSTH